ncbi:hypothetical protein QYF36_015808 [Acer negundo]|nr:hypothetical protein QYF36_015808 [Acer negundo]
MKDDCDGIMESQVNIMESKASWNVSLGHVNVMGKSCTSWASIMDASKSTCAHHGKSKSSCAHHGKSRSSWTHHGKSKQQEKKVFATLWRKVIATWWRKVIWDGKATCKVIGHIMACNLGLGSIG